MSDFINLNQRSPKTLIISLIGMLIISIGVIVALLLTSKSQDPRQNAATPSGNVEVSIAPPSRTLSQGETTTLTVSLNTRGTSISGVAVRLSYPITTSNPKLLTASNPTPLINQSDNKWSCQIASTETQADKVNIDFGCLYVANTGYANQSATPLFSFSVTAGQATITTPVTISFVNELTVATPKSGTQDIAAIPTTNSTITVKTEAIPTTTPVISPTTLPTTTPVISPTTLPTTTPSSTQSLPTPTPIAGLARCDQTCVANRDCNDNLSCINGRCRANRCPNDGTCLCEDVNVAEQNNTTTLPESGSVSKTNLLIIIGFLYIIAGSSFFIYNRTEPTQNHEN